MDFVSKIMETGLDGASERQKALSNNIANVDTPDYKRRDLDFISTLKKMTKKEKKLSLGITNERHLKDINNDAKAFKKVIISDTESRPDGNNVDIDMEMAEVAKNNIYYNTLAEQLNEKFKLLKDLINKGGSN
jgi:flagellar basal-body rod protein FlgB